MNHPQRLLELSESLVNLEPKRPRQATLRRAISTAYYAAFHLLIDEYASLFSDDPLVRTAIGRTVNHKDVAATARDFASSATRFPEALRSKGIVVTPQLVAVAQAFIDLQDERNDADYDLSPNYTRGEAREIFTTAASLFADWRQTRGTPAARLFLACFQLKKAWDVGR